MNLCKYFHFIHFGKHEYDCDTKDDDQDKKMKNDDKKKDQSEKKEVEASKLPHTRMVSKKIILIIYWLT